MIISHRHRVIFVHCRKVAGTSVKLLLAPHLGPWDVCIGAHEERGAHGNLPNLRCWFDALTRRGLREYLYARKQGRPRAGALNEAARKRYKPIFGNDPGHPNASDVDAAFPEEWNSYFKFCFVRNPYQRAVSDYFFSFGPEPDIPFLEFLESRERSIASGTVARRQIDNWPIYTIDDAPAVDFIGRYETFRSDLEKVIDLIGLPVPHQLPHAKKAAPYDYRDFYGPRETEVASRIYRTEIDHFGYRL